MSVLLLMALSLLIPAPAFAQGGEAPAELGVETEAEAEAQSEPRVGARPDWSWLEQLSFVTTSDFPPFNYYDEDGVLTGLNVDLARRHLPGAERELPGQRT